MPMDLELLNPLGFLMRNGPIPVEDELYGNVSLFLISMTLYLVAFFLNLFTITFVGFFGMYIYGFLIFQNLRQMNSEFEERRRKEAETSEEHPKEEEAEQSELEEGEIRETRRPATLEVSDDSDLDDLPQLVPAIAAWPTSESKED